MPKEKKDRDKSGIFIILGIGSLGAAIYFLTRKKEEPPGGGQLKGKLDSVELI